MAIMHGFKLTTKEITKLRLAHKQAKKNKKANHAYRLNSLILLGQGWSYREVSEALLLDEATLRRYISKYESGGIDEVLSDNYVPYLGKLTSSELEELSNHLNENTYRTVKEIAVYIEKTYDESYSISGLTTLLHNLGFVYKKPKKTPGKADAVKQQEFIKEYNKIKNSLKAEDSIYFADATHPHHTTIASYGWIKKGHTKPINTTVSRSRLNIHGALNVNNLSLITRYDDTINQQSSIEILFDLRKHQPFGKIYLILDNASYYQNSSFKYYADKLAITPIYLPAYSPNLNLIERLWLFFHRKQLYNKYYHSFHKFKKDTQSFFRNIGKYQTELSSLLADNFNILSLKRT